MRPIVDEVAKRFDGKVKLVSISLDDTSNSSKAEKYGITAVPTIVFLDSKGTVVDTVVGGIANDDLASKFKAIEGK
jgi:thioredoxin 1